MPPCNYVIQRSARSKPIVTHADKLKKCLGETPKSWLSNEQEVRETPALQQASEDDSSEASDEMETELDPPNPGESVTEEGAPEETEPEVNQQPVALEEVAKDVPGSDERALRNRGRLRRPARFLD